MTKGKPAFPSSSKIKTTALVVVLAASVAMVPIALVLFGLTGRSWFLHLGLTVLAAPLLVIQPTDLSPRLFQVVSRVATVAAIGSVSFGIYLLAMGEFAPSSFSSTVVATAAGGCVLLLVAWRRLRPPVSGSRTKNAARDDGARAPR